ncbi:hypothetical protein ACFX14_035273 [Malus domestica]
MALQLLKLPNHTIISRRFARWVGVPMHGTFAAVKFAKEEEADDELCLYRFQQYSRTFIRSWILQGKVCVDGKVVNKAGTPVSDKALVQIIAEVPISIAGHKLEAAIEQLGIDVSGKVALDSGLSTGGFTDCLLQYGASLFMELM